MDLPRTERERRAGIIMENINELLKNKIKAFNTMKAIRKGKALNKVLGKTAANITVYGVATAIGMLLDMVLR